MKKEITSIAPLRLGVIQAALYGIMGLIFVPVFLIMSLFAAHNSRTAGATGVALGGVVMAILLPVIYAVAGFVIGIIMAAIYNLITKWTGGLQFEVRHVPA